ncbi:hypothetical protein [Haloarchaeobius sp. DFWS5]|uniref:hypothetical protein n=1 Tax=Haloarchaeobius sp. DFWS5 TaxID=3446114 RepID=UPI003EB7AEEC
MDALRLFVGSLATLFGSVTATLAIVAQQLTLYTSLELFFGAALVIVGAVVLREGETTTE